MVDGHETIGTRRRLGIHRERSLPGVGRTPIDNGNPVNLGFHFNGRSWPRAASGEHQTIAFRPLRQFP